MSMLALDLVLPGAMKNGLELEDVRLYAFLDLLKEPGLLVCAKGEPWGKEKLCRGQFWESHKNRWLI